MDRDTLEAAARVCEERTQAYPPGNVRSVIDEERDAEALACAKAIRALAQQAGDDRCQSAVPDAAPLTLPEEPHRWHFVGYLCRYKDGVFQDQKEHSMARSDLSEPVVLWGDYDALRSVAEQAVAEAKGNGMAADGWRHQCEQAEAQVAALTEVYAAACIRLQALGEKTVPLTQDAAHSGKETT